MGERGGEEPTPLPTLAVLPVPWFERAEGVCTGSLADGAALETGCWALVSFSAFEVLAVSPQAHRESNLVRANNIVKIRYIFSTSFCCIVDMPVSIPVFPARCMPQTPRRKHPFWIFPLTRRQECGMVLIEVS